MAEKLKLEPVQKVEWLPSVAENPDLYWRFHAFVDFESPFQVFPIANINIERWRVMRRTPKGVWLAEPFTNKWNEEKRKRFVLNDSRKKYAYPTKIDAWKSYVIRQRHRSHYWEIEGRRVELLNALVESENDKLNAL